MRIVTNLHLFSREAELSLPGGDGSSSLSSSDTNPADGTALQVRAANYCYIWGSLDECILYLDRQRIFVKMMRIRSKEMRMVQVSEIIFHRVFWGPSFRNFRGLHQCVKFIQRRYRMERGGGGGRHGALLKFGVTIWFD